MNEKIHYLTLPSGLIVYRGRYCEKQVFVAVGENIFLLSPDGSLWKAMPTEIAEFIKVAVTDRHLNVIDGNIRNASRLSKESLEYVQGLINEAV